MPLPDHEPPVTLHCPYCGGQNVLADACARWNVKKQDWDLSTIYDDRSCDDCGTEISPVERPIVEGA